MKQNQEKRQETREPKQVRILARKVARELTDAELKAITGGGVSCSGGCADDCCEA